MKLDDLKSDPNAEEWIDCPELGINEATGEPVALLVRSLDYPAFKVDLQETRLRLLRRYPGGKATPPAEEDRENGRLYAKHLLRGWRGIEDQFSPELAFSVLTDPAHRDLRNAVAAAAGQVALRRAVQTEAVAGNSKRASRGA